MLVEQALLLVGILPTGACAGPVPSASQQAQQQYKAGHRDGGAQIPAMQAGRGQDSLVATEVGAATVMRVP